MGKKEEEIKRINTEYYKERNKIDNHHKIKELEYEKKSKLQIEAQESFEKTHMFVSSVISDLKGYSEQQGLPLCEYLDEVNVENYINFVVGGCPSKVTGIKKIKHVEPPIEQAVKVKFEMTPEIKKMKEDIITKAGEHDILTEYLREHYPNGIPENTTEKEIMDLLRTTLIRVSRGEKKYYDVVKRLGTYHYNNTAKKLNL